MISTKLTTTLFLVFLGSYGLFGQSINTLTITSPDGIAGEYDAVVADFGDQSGDAISGDLMFGMDDTDPINDGCTPLVNDLTGLIGLIDRGECEFGVKSLAVQNAGAIAVVVCNDEPGNPIGMQVGEEGDNVTILSVMISQGDCNTIRTEMANGTVSGTLSYVAPPSECPIDYDTTVVWGANGEGEFSDGLGDWTTMGVTAPEDEWIWTADNTSNGVLQSDNVLDSPTFCNGSALIDYDFLSTGGDPAVLNALGFPYPTYSSQLISPTMDLSGTEFPTVEFYQFNLPLNGATSMSYSLDNGQTWAPEIEVPTENILTASVNNVVGTEFRSFSLTEAADNSEVKIRFTATGGDFYYWMIDDVVVKDIRIEDVRANGNFYSTATNFRTPIDQIEPIPFLIDIENTGNIDINNVNLTVTVTNDESGEVIHTDNIEYGDIPAGFLDENRIFEERFLPPNEVGTYRTVYEITSDNDLVLDNNSQEYTFEITDDVFAKVLPESEFGMEYLGNRAAPNEYFQSYGNYYYIPQGDGLVAKETSFGVVIDDLSISPGFIGVSLYQWIDVNEDGVCDPQERLELSSDDILISDELTAEQLRDYRIEFTSTSGDQIALSDDSHYLVMANMKPLQTTGDQYRIVAANTEIQTEYSYNPMSFALEMGFGELRFGSFSGNGADGTPQDVENRVFNFNPFWSVYMPLTIGEPVSNVETAPSIEARVFPNPATDRVIVDLVSTEDNAQDVVLQLMTLDGKVLKTQKEVNVRSSKVTIDLNDVPTGIYTLNVKTTSSFTSSKVVVSK